MMGKLYIGSRMISFTGICASLSDQFWMEDFFYRICGKFLRKKIAKDESFNFIRTCVYTFGEN